MKISLGIPDSFTVTNHGYGVISRDIVESLQRLGHRITLNDPEAQVALNIGMPYHWLWPNRDAYKIGLVAWESTGIPDNWKPGLRFADEIWTPSQNMANWFAEAGFPGVKVYEHGVDSELWQPRPRRYRPGRPIKFLHMGEPAPRKGGQMTHDAFSEVFGDDPESAILTIKAHGYNSVRGSEAFTVSKDGNLYLTPAYARKSVRVITDELPEDELVALVQQHDVLVYPSYGEGFGLIPLQAMATGMPVICTAAWAPYKSFILPQLRLESRLAPSPWPRVHPGNMLHPDFEDLKATMRFVADNFETVAKQAFQLVPHIQRKYNWDRLTQEAFEPVVKKLNNNG